MSLKGQLKWVGMDTYDFSRTKLNFLDFGLLYSSQAFTPALFDSYLLMHESHVSVIVRLPGSLFCSYSGKGEKIKYDSSICMIVFLELHESYLTFFLFLFVWLHLSLVILLISLSTLFEMIS